MRIDASSLAVDGLRYTSPRDEGGVNQVVLGRSGGVTGYYEHTDAGHGVDAQATVFDVRTALWHVGEGQLGVEQETRLHEVVLKLGVPSGDGNTTLHLGVQSAHLAHARYGTGTLEVRGAYDLEGALVERDTEGKLTVVAVKVDATEVHLTSGTTEVTAAELHAARLSVASRTGSTRFACEGLELRNVRVTAGAVAVTIERVEAPTGIVWQDGHIDLSELVLSGIEVGYTFAKKSEAPAELATTDASPWSIPDIPALDKLDGRFDMDVKVHVHLPILKERGATHALRIPIHSGVISFGELEHGFSSLADALLDFEVEGDELILELDVLPLVKFDNVTLVSWNLAEPADKQLAEQKRVRLRRLLQFKLPSHGAKKKSQRHDEGAIRLVGIDFDDVAVDLSLRGPAEFPVGGGVLRLGNAEGWAVESLRLRGHLHTSVSGEPESGQLDLTVSGIHAAFERVALGAVQLLTGTLDIDGIESARADFTDLAPGKLAARIHQARLRGVGMQTGS